MHEHCCYKIQLGQGLGFAKTCQLDQDLFAAFSSPLRPIVPVVYEVCHKHVMLIVTNRSRHPLNGDEQESESLSPLVKTR